MKKNKNYPAMEWHKDLHYLTISDALISSGMNRYVAKTLTYLLNLNDATLVELEKGAGMHQPDVSIVMKEVKYTISYESSGSIILINPSPKDVWLGTC